jgi:hypothetical protein
MEKLIYRKNKMFCIDKSKLKPEAQATDVISALYAAIYSEFSGAMYNSDYKDLSNLERFEKVNEFAVDWLTKRGLL